LKTKTKTNRNINRKIKQVARKTPIAETSLEERRRLKQVLELAMQAGELLLRSGAEISRIEETISIIAKTYGVNYIQSVVTPTGVYISIDNGFNEDSDNPNYPMTLIHRVRNRSLNYNRITQVNALSRRIAEGMVLLEQAMRELDQINHASDLYSAWVKLLGGAGTAGGATLLLGGTPLDVAPSLLSTILAQILIGWLNRSRIPNIFGEFFGAVLASVVAMLLVWLKVPIHPSMVIAGGIILLVPGSALLASVQDGISGDLLSSAARGLEAIIKGAAIAGGVGLGLNIAVSLHLEIPLNQAIDTTTWQIPVQVGAAFCAASCYALANQIPRFAILTAGLAGGIGWLAYLSISDWLDNTGLLATTLAAFVAGLLSWRLARLQHAPLTLYILPGILPLLPGLTIYNGMLNLAQNQTSQGILLLAHAVFLGGALAAGVALSTSLALTFFQHKIPFI
jgi:uncharacterized membrane protein YjjP (DUF1212 family)